MQHRISPEQRLFMAVINQQVLDACSIPLLNKPERKNGESDQRYDSRCRNRAKSYQDSINIRDTARQWLKDERAVRTLCDIAGMSYEYVLRKAKEIEENNWKPLGSSPNV